MTALVEPSSHMQQDGCNLAPGDVRCWRGGGHDQEGHDRGAGVDHQLPGIGMLSYLSANNDETLFDQPERFRVDRDASQHIAFGTGIHACLGQHLANLEMRILFEELIPRLKTLELAGEPKRSASTFIGGPKSVPVNFVLR